MANFPEELKYDKDKSWVKVEDGVATIGVIEPAVKQVEEFAFVDLPKKGEIKKGDVYVSLEASKWSGHLESPVSGEVVEVNEELFDEPSKINEDPYGSWIMKVKISDEKEVEELLSASEKEKQWGEK